LLDGAPPAPLLVELQSDSITCFFSDIIPLTNIPEPTIDITAAQAGDTIHVYNVFDFMGSATQVDDWHEPGRKLIIQRNRTSAIAQCRYPVIQSRVRQGGLAGVPGVRVMYGFTPVEYGQVILHHRLAVADAIAFDILKNPRCHLEDGVSLMRQSEVWILGERSVTEWAPPAGQKPFD